MSGQYANFPVEGGGSSGVSTLNGLSGAVVIEVGTGLSVNVTGQNILLTNTQAPGITALTGDVTATGPGSSVSSLVATSNSTLVTLSALSLPGSQVTGNISGNAANILATSNSTLTTLSSLSLPASQVTGLGGPYLPLAGGTMTGVLNAAVGSVASPGISINGNGFYDFGGGHVGFSSEGATFGYFGHNVGWFLGDATYAIQFVNGTCWMLMDANGTGHMSCYITTDANSNSLVLSGGGKTGGSGFINLNGTGFSSNAGYIIFGNDNYSIAGSIAPSSAFQLGASSQTPQHILNTSTATAGSNVGTFTNLPSAYSGNPTGYIQITINGGTHVIPYW